MGNQQSFASIQKKYGQKGTQYVAAKYHERKIYQRINDQIVRLNKHATLQQQQDIEFINHEKRRLQKSLDQAKNEAELQKKGSLQEAEARHKMKAQDFSGYNEKRIFVENLEKQIKNKYATERVRMQEKVRDEIRKHQSGGSTLIKIPEYDKHPDNDRRNIENQCIKKYPAKAKQLDSTELQKKLTWQNYKQNFVTILNRDQVKKEVDIGCETIKNNIAPGNAPICC